MQHDEKVLVCMMIGGLYQNGTFYTCQIDYNRAKVG
jgi:hypothetical protein